VGVHRPRTDAVQQSFGDRGGFGLLAADEDGDELVAAVTAYEIASTKDRRCSRSHYAQYLVADKVPMEVVDRLEPVDVKHDDP
jgi:hypothetical protein